MNMKKPTSDIIAAIANKLNVVASTRINEAKKQVASGLLKEAKTNPDVKAWVDKYTGKDFIWIKGREKDMSFQISHFGQDVSGNDPHVRGSYENHPQFGHIRDDAHQLMSLLDDIVDGNVKVMDYGYGNEGDEKDVTAKCKLDSERLIDDLADDDDYDDDDDDYDDEDEEEMEEGWNRSGGNPRISNRPVKALPGMSTTSSTTSGMSASTEKELECRPNCPSWGGAACKCGRIADMIAARNAAKGV